MNHRLVIFIFFILNVHLSIFYGQDINGNFRMLDNNHAIRADTNDISFFRIIKEIPFDRNGFSNMSLGMDIREQMRLYQHTDFGDVPPDINDQDVFLMQRYMVHVNLELGKMFRLFVQMNSSHISWKNTIAKTDMDQLGLTQAFIDINLPTALPVRIRGGRQEISFGSERFMGTRDGPNIRQSFDGARFTISSKKTTGDFFIVTPVYYDFGVFDNKTKSNALVFSGYLATHFNSQMTLDLLYFGDKRQMAGHDSIPVQEFRHSFGARFTGSLAGFYYEAEGEWQAGTSAQNSIQAWQLWATEGYQWNGSFLNPRLQIRTAFMSGDRDSTDRKTNTFRPVSPKSPINDIVPVGPANIFVLSGEGEIRLMKNLGLILRYYAIWRVSEEDGIYSVDMQRIIRQPDTANEEKGLFMAKGFTIELNYQINKHLNINLLGGQYKPGTYIKNTGAGKDLEALALKITLRF